jgi:hypothetical protein
MESSRSSRCCSKRPSAPDAGTRPRAADRTCAAACCRGRRGARAGRGRRRGARRTDAPRPRGTPRQRRCEWPTTRRRRRPPAGRRAGGGTRGTPPDSRPRMRRRARAGRGGCPAQHEVVVVRGREPIGRPPAALTLGPVNRNRRNAAIASMRRGQVRLATVAGVDGRSSRPRRESAPSLARAPLVRRQGRVSAASSGVLLGTGGVHLPPPRGPG